MNVVMLSKTPPGPARGERGDRDRDEQRDDEGVEQQLEGDGQPLRQDRRHRLAAAERVAEVPAQRAGQPVPVADEERLVQVQLLAERGDLRRRRVRAEQRLGRVARQQVKHGEAEERDAPDDRDRGEQPADGQPQQGGARPEAREAGGRRPPGARGRRGSRRLRAGRRGEITGAVG
jgi:hypothetical protein